jgi:hypothetical protein
MGKLFKGLLMGVGAIFVAGIFTTTAPMLGLVAGGLLGASMLKNFGPFKRAHEVRQARIQAEQAARLERARLEGQARARYKTIQRARHRRQRQANRAQVGATAAAWRDSKLTMDPATGKPVGISQQRGALGKIFKAEATAEKIVKHGIINPIRFLQGKPAI